MFLGDHSIRLQLLSIKAEGAIVTDVDGNQIIDLAGAIGTINVGHCPHRVVEAIKNQLDRFIHSG
jgi:4-aminobutyrate aminotransferase/(S)-3-amino-2-methylpropionate transaminase